MSYLIAISGASGSIYGLRLIEELNKKEIETGLIITEPAVGIIKDELDYQLDKSNINEGVAKLLKLPYPEKLKYFDYRVINQGPASGSYQSQGMIVIPASMATMGAIAGGLANNLLTRAADVHLKENWPLILVPRETPLNKIHLQNMLRLVEAGATILPAMPGFYHKPENIDDLVNFIVGKVLRILGYDHDLFPSWGADNS